MRGMVRIRGSLLPVGMVVASLLVVAGCASHGPVLYPNAHLQSMGQERAKADIEECGRKADEYVHSDEGVAIAKSTAAGGAGGAVVGGAVGAVTGGFGRGVGIGAAAGGAMGLVHGISRSSRPSPLYRNFVDRCLREKGYEPIGWQ